MITQLYMRLHGWGICMHRLPVSRYTIGWQLLHLRNDKAERR